MKQLYYTSCRTGKSIGGSSGFQVRATSPNLPPDRLRALIPYVGYSLPQNIIPKEDTHLASPIRLAFLITADAGRLLCHGAYIGKDPMTGRFGNFFSHALLNLPENLEAGEAIFTWKSEFWKKIDDDGDSNLEEIESLPKGDISASGFISFLKIEANKKMFRFLLQAILIVKEGGRIFIAAPAEEVALCIFGITQALPKTVLKNFTFSTYESDPLSCGAKLIGTWLGDNHESELPSSCFRGTNYGYNKTTEKKTSIQETGLQEEKDFIAFCISAITSEKEFENVTKLRKQCENLEINSIVLFLTYFYFLKNKEEPLSNDDSLVLFSSTKIAGSILKGKKRVEILNIIILKSKLDEEYHQKIYPLIGKIFNDHPDLISNLENNNDELFKRINSWVCLTSFMKTPTFTKSILNSISHGIKIDINANPKQEKALSQLIDLTIITMLKKKNADYDEINSSLKILFKCLGPAVTNHADLFKLIKKPYAKNKTSNPNSTVLREVLISIGLGNDIDHPEFNPDSSPDLSWKSFGNRLTGDLKYYIAEFKNKSEKNKLKKLDNKNMKWNKEAKKRWIEFTEDLIDRRTLWQKIYMGFILFSKIFLLLTVLLIPLVVLDELKFKRIMPYSWFLRGIKNMIWGPATELPKSNDKKNNDSKNTDK